MTILNATKRAAAGIAMSALYFLLTGAHIAAAQSVFDGFNPGANGIVSAIAIQSDGRIIVGGGFTAIGGGTGTVSQVSLGRLKTDGTVDGLETRTDGFVTNLAIQPDGKILVAGTFTTLTDAGGTVSRNALARLNADGSIDRGFDPHPNNGVLALCVMEDGKILVGGAFTTLGSGNGAAGRSFIARLLSDGQVDPAFNPGANDYVTALTVQGDGRVLVGGKFTMIGGGGTGSESRAHLARLEPNGTVDVTFSRLILGLDSLTSVSALQVQPDGKILAGGRFYYPQANFMRLLPDGRVDAGFPVSVDGPNVAAIELQPDGKIVVAGDLHALFGANSSNSPGPVGRYLPDGSVDQSFTYIPTGAGSVFAVALQQDGKLVVGGYFSSIGFGPSAVSRLNLARFEANGQIEVDFAPGANDQIHAMAVQADGRIIVGGKFTMIGGGGTGNTVRHHIARLLPNGQVDPTFNPGTNNDVYSIVVQPDGKILLGGFFTQVGGGTGTTVRRRLARLNADGTIDLSFDPDAGTDGPVYALLLHRDGTIIVGGNFTTFSDVNGTVSRKSLARTNANGTLDATFDPGADSEVFSLALQDDNRILVGGNFTTLGGGGSGTTARRRLGRLETSGAIDASFDPGANAQIRAIVVQPDGRILVAGNFTTIGGGGTGSTPRNRVARLLQNGAVESGFNPDADDYVYTMALQTDGHVVIGGSFATVGGNERQKLARVHADGSIDVDFNPGVSAGNVFPVSALAVQADAKILVGGLFPPWETAVPAHGLGTLSVDSRQPPRHCKTFGSPTRGEPSSGGDRAPDPTSQT